jgi:hypothetical protein
VALLLNTGESLAIAVERQDSVALVALQWEMYTWILLKFAGFEIHDGEVRVPRKRDVVYSCPVADLVDINLWSGIVNSVDWETWLMAWQENTTIQAEIEQREEYQREELAEMRCLNAEAESLMV